MMNLVSIRAVGRLTNMHNNIIEISLSELAIAFIPIVPVLVILHRWHIKTSRTLYALARMLGQLMIVGYFLAYLFHSANLLIISLVLMTMLFASSWIALGTVAEHRRRLLANSLLSIFIGGGSVLIIVIVGVLHPHPLYTPQYVIPLAGMIFSNAMNSVSLCAERIHSEMQRGDDYLNARYTAFQAAMIPVTNSLFAVGIVSLPGMMTGQILSGVSPLIAARYQIVVMCMVYASAGLSAAFFLWKSKNTLEAIAVK